MKTTAEEDFEYTKGFKLARRNRHFLIGYKLFKEMVSSLFCKLVYSMLNRGYFYISI
jgi:hypothetical protein